MACTVKPSITAPGCRRATRSSMVRAACSTAASVSRCRATPPTSLLCVICGDRIFSTAGRPTSRAAATAAAGSAGTTRVPTTGTPQAASTALASGSVSHSRPCASACSTTAATAAASTTTCSPSGGHSASAAWLSR